MWIVVSKFLQFIIINIINDYKIYENHSVLCFIFYIFQPVVKNDGSTFFTTEEGNKTNERKINLLLDLFC